MTTYLNKTMTMDLYNKYENITSYNNYKEFYDNKVIQELGEKDHWTISEGKKPINFKAFLKDPSQKLQGLGHKKTLKQAAKTECVDLKTLGSIMKKGRFTYVLDCLKDNYVVMDIEPTCTKELKEKLLKLPYLYGEVSMSGHGYHLILPLPKDVIKKYPNAKKKNCLKGEKNMYEILMYHTVTFTGKTINPVENFDPKNKEFEKLFESLAKDAKNTIAKPIDIEKNKPKIIDEKKIIYYMKTHYSYNKTLEDFDDDISDFDFGIIGHSLHLLKQALRHPTIKKNKHKYTDNESIWLLFNFVSDIIEYRDKHNRQIKGMPYLLYQSKRCFERQKQELNDKYERTQKDNEEIRRDK